MNEIKDLTFTLSYDYGNLKRFENIFNRTEIEYTIDDLLDEIERLNDENQEYENENNDLRNEIEKLNNKIKELKESEEKENDN